jgi:hypothetical protein
MAANAASLAQRVIGYSSLSIHSYVPCFLLSFALRLLGTTQARDVPESSLGSIALATRTGCVLREDGPRNQIPYLEMN